MMLPTKYPVVCPVHSPICPTNPTVFYLTSRTWSKYRSDCLLGFSPGETSHTTFKLCEFSSPPCTRPSWFLIAWWSISSFLSTKFNFRRGVALQLISIYGRHSLYSVSLCSLRLVCIASLNSIHTQASSQAQMSKVDYTPFYARCIGSSGLQS